MAVRADWTEVLDRVNLIAGRCKGQLHCVVDVDEVLSAWPVAVFEGEVADCAAVTPMLETGLAGARIALILVYLDPCQRAFWERLPVDSAGLIWDVGERMRLPAGSLLVRP
jgi:hypothetical protein